MIIHIQEGEMAKRRKRRQTSSRLPIPVWIVGLAGLILVVAGLIVLTDQGGTDPDASALPYPNIPRISPAELSGIDSVKHEYGRPGHGCLNDRRTPGRRGNAGCRFDAI